MTANSFEMSLQTLEGLSIGDIIDHHDALVSFEVRVVDSLKGFFSCRVPYLSPNNISVMFDVLGPELNSNGDFVFFGKSVIDISASKRSLPCA